jgi:hypothetical protein
MKIIKCKNCGAETPSRSNKIFCSKKCVDRFHASEKHNRLKDNKEYKEKRNKIFKNWLKKNREHHNDLMREISREWQRKASFHRKINGLCMYCGGERDSKFLNCNKCREKLRKRYEAKQNKMRRM